MEWNTKSGVLGIIAAILAVGTMISGTIIWSAEKREELLHLREQVYMLRTELAKRDALLNQALSTLHHERLHHFEEVLSEDASR